MKTIMFTLLLVFASSSACADSGKIPLLQCGFKLGNSKLQFAQDSKWSSTWSNKWNGTGNNTRGSGKPLATVRVLGSADVDTQTRQFTAVLPNNSRDSDRRLPRAVTVARFGCALR